MNLKSSFPSLFLPAFLSVPPASEFLFHCCLKVHVAFSRHFLFAFSVHVPASFLRLFTMVLEMQEIMVPVACLVPSSRYFCPFHGAAFPFSFPLYPPEAISVPWFFSPFFPALLSPSPYGPWCFSIFSAFSDFETTGFSGPTVEAVQFCLPPPPSPEPSDFPVALEPFSLLYFVPLPFLPFFDTRSTFGERCSFAGLSF